MPPLDEYRRGRDEAVHRVDKGVPSSIQVLGPVAAAQRRRPFELRPELACSRLVKPSPPRIARPLLEKKRAEQRARRAPHEFACEMVHRLFDEPGQLVGRFPGRLVPVAQQLNARVAHQVAAESRRAAVSHCLAVRLQQRINEGRVVALQPARAARLQVAKRPEHAAGAPIEHVGRRRPGAVVGVRRPQRLGRKAGFRLAHDLRDRCAHQRFVPGDRDQRFMAVGREEHGVRMRRAHDNDSHPRHRGHTTP